MEGPLGGRVPLSLLSLFQFPDLRSGPSLTANHTRRNPPEKSQRIGQDA
jgi:hypothetical protein